MGLFKRRPRDFDTAVRRLVADLVGDASLIEEVDADTLRIGSSVVGLTNLRAKWNRLDDEDRIGWLEATIPALISPPSLPDRLETTQHLRPGIRPRSMLEAARLTNLVNEVHPGGRTDRPLIPFQPFGGDLVTVLLWDAPTTMSVVNQSQLDDWDARFNDLLPVAIDNLEEAPDNGWGAVNNRVWTSLNEDDYAGARMLLPGYLDKTALAGELVVIHPNRNLLIVTAVDDSAGIKIACEQALEELTAPSPVSFQPLVGRDGDWRPLVLPPTHPAFESLQKLTCINEEMNYSSVREPLRQLVGDELHIAEFHIAQNPDGSYVSYCEWTEDVSTLLPRTELILMRTAAGEEFRVPWAAVHREVTTMMEPTDHYPELWRVLSFPAEATLDRLRHLSSN